MEKTLTRRRAITSTGAAIVGVALAGCTSDNEDPDSAGGSNDQETDSQQQADGSNEESTPEATEEPTEEPTDTPTEEPTPTTEPEPPLEIIEHEAFAEEFSSGVRGVVRNNTDQTVDYLEVEARFFDEDGTRVGENFTNATDLSGGTEWQFEIMYLGESDEWAEYEIVLSDTPF